MGLIRSAGHALGRHGVALMRAQSPGGSSVCVAVSLLAAAVLSGADFGVAHVAALCMTPARWAWL